MKGARRRINHLRDKVIKKELIRKCILSTINGTPKLENTDIIIGTANPKISRKVVVIFKVLSSGIIWSST